MDIPWSKRRKILEQDFLCDSLKGSVAYFAARYRTAHDHTGRVCISVDKQEILNMPYETENEIYRLMNDAKKIGFQRGKQLYEKTKDDLANEGKFVAWDFGCACDEYLKNPIDKSLKSENMLVRMFDVMDRRVGKKTLDPIRTEAANLPEWLQYFYNLRIYSESASKIRG